MFLLTVEDFNYFLLTVHVSLQVETLRDSLPPSDKSLSRLLGEVPSLPNSVLKLLECMCSPENCDKTEKDIQGGDWVTQGLSTVWSLILQRPPFRDGCLKIALQVPSVYLYIALVCENQCIQSFASLKSAILLVFT